MGLLSALFASALCIFAAFPAFANPIPADEVSLLNGADSFERYCTECHGWDPSQQYDSLYADDPVDGPDPLFDLGSADTNPYSAGGLSPPRELDDRPEWAGEPLAVEGEEDLALRADILSDLTGVISDVYDDDSSSYGSDYDYQQGSVLDEDLGGIGEEPDSQSLRASGATDLTEPGTFFYGTSENDLYNSIARGTGVDMPGFLDQLGSEDVVWDLVNYIRSLWDEDWVD